MNRIALKRALSIIVSVALALMLVPVLPTSFFGDYDVPAYASEGNPREVDLDDNVRAGVNPDMLFDEPNPDFSPDDLEPAGVTVLVKHTFIDASLADGTETTTSIMQGDDFDKFYSMSMSQVELYNPGPDSEKLVCFLTPTAVNGMAESKPSNAVCAMDNECAIVVREAEFDLENAIMYIPKWLYQIDNFKEYGIEVQTVEPIDVSRSTVPVEVHIDNQRGDVTAVADSRYADVNPFDVDFTIPVATPSTAASITLDDIDVKLNGSEFSIYKEGMRYDQGTGLLTIRVCPGAIAQVDVTIEEDALLGIERAHAYDWGCDIWLFMDGAEAFTDLEPDSFALGSSFRYDGNIYYDAGTFRYLSSSDYLYSCGGAATGWNNQGIAKWVYNGNIADGDPYYYYEGKATTVYVACDPPQGVINGLDVSNNFSKLALQCSHIVDYTDLGTNRSADVFIGKIQWRCMAKTDDSITIGIVTAPSHNQNGWGLYRFATESRGKIQLNKQAVPSARDWSEPLKTYSYKGAVYSIYTNPECTAQATYKDGTAATMVTGQTADMGDGYAVSGDLKKGTYYVKETSVPPGYALNRNQVLTFTVVPKETVWPSNEPLALEDVPTPLSPNYSFAIEKVDFDRYADSNGDDYALDAQGAGKLVDTEFNVIFADGYYTTKDQVIANAWRGWRSTRISTKRMTVDGKDHSIAVFDSAELAKTSAGLNTLPLGTFYIEEAAPPDGYHMTKGQEDGYIVQVTRAADLSHYNVTALNVQPKGSTSGTITKTGSSSISVSNPILCLDQVKRADIGISKYVEPTANPEGFTMEKEPAPNISFEIYNENAADDDKINSGYVRRVNVPDSASFEEKYAAPGELIYTIKTNSYGYCSTSSIRNVLNQTGQASGALPYGDYRIVEVEPPAGYDKIPDTYVSLRYSKGGDCEKPCCTDSTFGYNGTADNEANLETGGDVHCTFNDYWGTVIEVVKADSGPDKKPVRGQMQFQVLKENKETGKLEPIEFTTYAPSNAKYTTLTTNAYGKAILPEKFQGGTFYIKEVKAPAGYLLDPDAEPVAFTCDSDTAHDNASYDNPLVVTIENDPATGIIQIEKHDGTPQGDLVTRGQARYRVTAADDIVTADGTIRASAGTEVAIVTTANGVGRTGELYPGRYNIQEIQAPEGYLLDSTVHEIRLRYIDDRTTGEANVQTFKFADTRVMGRISVEKRDAVSGNVIPIAKNDRVTFKVYAKSDIVDGTGKTWHHAGDYIEDIALGPDGRGESAREYQLGQYEVQEMSAPAGYALDSKREPVTLSSNDSVTPVVYATATKADVPQYFELTVTKLDREANEELVLPNTTMELRAAEDVMRPDGSLSHAAGKLVDTITTDETGKARTSAPDIVAGKYVLRETKAPEGYVLDSAREFPVTLASDGKGTALVKVPATISDEPARGTITFSKVDADSGAIVEVEGCTAKIYADEDILIPTAANDADKAVYCPAGTLVDTITTDGSGTATSKPLRLGRYRIVEEMAPYGYLYNATPTYVTLSYKDQVTPVVSAAGEIEDERAMGTITVTKRQIDGGIVKVPGAVFQIKAKEDIVTGDGTKHASAGDAVDTITTDETGTCTSKELELGLYTVQEITAPEGYVLDPTVYDAPIIYKDQMTAVTSTPKEISNAPQKGIITVTKVDAETDKVVLEAGATFEVRAAEDIVTGDGATQLTKGALADTITTDASGTASTKALFLGRYTISETRAPEGYTLSDEVKEVTLSYGSQTEPLVYEMESIKDQPVKGQISVTKDDTEIDEPLSGVVYEIRAADDIIGKDGTNWFEKGAVADTLTTDEAGYAISRELPLGSYVVVETVQPNGYELDTEEHPADLIYQGQGTPLVTIERAYHNTPSHILVKKVSISDESRILPDTHFIGWDKAAEADIAEPFAIYASEGYEVESASADYMGPLRNEIDGTPEVQATLTFEKAGYVTQSPTASDEAEDKADEAALAVQADAADVESDGTGEATGLYTLYTAQGEPLQGTYVMHMTYTLNGEQAEESFEFTINEHDTNAYFALGTITAIDAIDRAGYFGKAIFEDATNDDQATDEGSEAVPALLADATDETDSATTTEPDGSEGEAGSAADDEQANTEDEAEDAPEIALTENPAAKRVPVVIAWGTFAYSITGEDGLAEFKYIPQGTVGFSEYQAPCGYANDREPQYSIFSLDGTIEGADDLEAATKPATEAPEVEPGDPTALDPTVDNAGLDGADSDKPNIVRDGDVIGLRFADEELKMRISKRDITNSEELPGNVLAVFTSLIDATMGTEDEIDEDAYGELIETWVSTTEPHMMDLIPRGAYILKEEQAVEGFTIAEDIMFQVNDTGVVQQVAMNNHHAAGVASELVETLGETGTEAPVAVIFAIFLSSIAVFAFSRRSDIAKLLRRRD